MGLRVLITGARGMYGVHLIELLVSDPDVEMIYALDNGSRQTLSDDPWIRPAGFDQKVRVIVADFQDLTPLKLNQMHCDVVVHLAAYVSIDESMTNPEAYFENNERGTFYFLQALQRTIRPPLLIYASSSEIYGAPVYTPMDEQHPAMPRSVYAATKLAAERHILALHAWHRYPAVVVRNFNTYGENQNLAGYPAVIPVFIQRMLRNEPVVIHHDGQQTRDFLYVKDAVKAYRELIFHGRDHVGEVFNIGTGQETRIVDLAHLIRKLTGSSSPIRYEPGRPADLPRLCADIQKIHRALGWQPRFTLEEGLQRTIAWFRAHLLP
jgi:UDP-glucose 4-epimerase